MNKRKMVKVCEWITSVGIGIWKVPDGCIKVDCCIVAGGDNGKDGIGYQFGGNGGNGGSMYNKTNISVIGISEISYTVGGTSQNTKFSTFVAAASTGPVGGKGYGDYAMENGVGDAGGIGWFPFGDNVMFKLRLCNAGGGGSGAHSEYVNEIRSYPGGSPNGGSAYANLSEQYAFGGDGGNGATFGSGGGGRGFAIGGATQHGGANGTGAQGCIILMYERRKFPTDVVDPDTGIVKVNWPGNA